MKERLNKALERVDELTLRERAVILGAMLTVLFLAWYAYLLEPLQAREKALLSELETKRVQLQTLNEQFLLMADQQRHDPNAVGRAKLQAMRDEEERLTGELRTATANLVAPEFMPDVLRSMLSSAHGLSFVKLTGLGSERLLQKPDAPEPGGTAEAQTPAAISGPTLPGELEAAYKHGMQMDFTGDFFATLDFLRRVESLQWSFFWDSVSFDVDEYPQATASIRVFTLSLDRDWIGT